MERSWLARCTKRWTSGILREAGSGSAIFSSSSGHTEAGRRRAVGNVLISPGECLLEERHACAPQRFSATPHDATPLKLAPHVAGAIEAGTLDPWKCIHRLPHPDVDSWGNSASDRILHRGLFQTRLPDRHHPSRMGVIAVIFRARNDTCLYQGLLAGTLYFN